MTTQEGATMDTGEAVDKLWDDDTMLTRYRVAFDKNPDVHLWGFLCWLRDDMLKAATRRREATTMQDETVGDKQLMLAAEAIVVGKFGIYTVYRELQRVRDDALATQAAELDRLERDRDRWQDLCTSGSRNATEAWLDWDRRYKALEAESARLRAELADTEMQLARADLIIMEYDRS